MNNFNYYNPTRIIFGKDRLNELNDFIQKGARVLVIYESKSLKKYKYTDKIINALKDYTVFEFWGIKSQPNFETLVKAIKMVNKKKINFLLGVGGNSTMDGTKFVSLASSYKGNIQNFLTFNTKNFENATALPMGMIVTVPSSSSEMNCCSSILYNNKRCYIKSPLIFPKFSILDPSLTYNLPKKLIASGIIDTFVHLTEKYLNIPINDNVQNRTIEGILKTLFEIGKDTIDNPTDYNLRANLFWCSSVGASKLIDYSPDKDLNSHIVVREIRAIFGIEHEKTLAIVAPSLWHIIKAEKKEKLLLYATQVLNITSGTEDEKIDLAISKTREFFESLGVKTHLSDYGIRARDINDMLKYIDYHKTNLLGEDKSITLDISRKILQDSL